MQDRQAPELNGGDGGVNTEDESASGFESAQDSMSTWMRDICLHLGLGEDDCCVKCGDPSKSKEHKRNHIKCIAKCILCGTQDHPDSMCLRMREPEFRKIFTDNWFHCRLQMNGFPTAKPTGNPKPPGKGVPTGPKKLPTQPRSSRGGLGGRSGFGDGWSGYEGNTFCPPQPPSIPRPLPGASHAHWRAYREQEQDKKMRREEVEEVEEEVLTPMEVQERKAEYARRNWQNTLCKIEEARRNWQQALREVGVSERRMHEEEKKLEEMEEKRKAWWAQNVPVDRVNVKVQIKRLRKRELAGEDGHPLGLKDMAMAKAKAGDNRQSSHAQVEQRLAELKRLEDVTAREKRELEAGKKKLEKERMDFEAQRESERRQRNPSNLPSLPGSEVEESEPEESEPEEAGDGIKLPIRRRNRRRDPSLDSLNGRMT